jgi:hypothetical protein
MVKLEGIRGVIWWSGEYHHAEHQIRGKCDFCSERPRAPAYLWCLRNETWQDPGGSRSHRPALDSRASDLLNCSKELLKKDVAPS